MLTRPPLGFLSCAFMNEDVLFAEMMTVFLLFDALLRSADLRDIFVMSSVERYSLSMSLSFSSDELLRSSLFALKSIDPPRLFR